MPEKDLQNIVGNVLRYGVYTAMVVVIIGLTFYLVQYGATVVDYSTFDATNTFNPKEFWSSLLTGNSTTIMEAGVILLIATPIIRLVFTLIGFWSEKDIKYTLISLIVLCIIAYSLFLGAPTH